MRVADGLDTRHCHLFGARGHLKGGSGRLLVGIDLHRKPSRVVSDLGFAVVAAPAGYAR